jgi:hypothetical protein
VGIQALFLNFFIAVRVAGVGGVLAMIDSFTVDNQKWAGARIAASPMDRWIGRFTFLE